jgi:hypothetical protein
MKNTKIFFVFLGTFLILILINPIEIFGQERYQHPDASYQRIILNNILIGTTSVYAEMDTETVLVIFWLYEMAFKLLLVATGVVVFCIIFICKGFYRLIRHGAI